METPNRAAATLEPYRQYLLVLASVHLAPELRSKLDPADLVQQTFLRAGAAFAELRAVEPAGVAAWLRAILANELSDALKHFRRDKRDVTRERSIEADLNRSSSGMADWLDAKLTSPSRKAARNEEMLRLADALAELPQAMREVVVLKHCQGWTLKQIGERMEKSVAAVASLLRRGLEQLRTRLEPPEPDDD